MMTNNTQHDKVIIEAPTPRLLDGFEGGLELNVGYEAFA